MRKTPKKWKACPACHLLIFAEANSLGQHRCSPKVQAKKDAELDAVIEEEMTTWDKDVKKFWRSKDVRFTRFLLRKGLYD